ncbi:MAG: hypothetical protein IJ740_01150 [Ruminococcus sp.]|nr:hypothetical protein [Ruminococcus sp.]
MKKIISSVPALGLAFGAAAYLPESITPQSGITAQAASSVKTFDLECSVLMLMNQNGMMYVHILQTV